MSTTGTGAMPRGQCQRVDSVIQAIPIRHWTRPKLMSRSGRRKLGFSHSKLTEVLHPDFADCSALAEALRGQDAAIFCLGVYTGAVADAELCTITVDYTVEFARVLRGSSPMQHSHS
jgi:hypothetical protein